MTVLGAVMHDASATAMVGRPRFTAALRAVEPKSFDSIVTIPSNAQAVESALMFATGRTPFVAIVGPSGCGKSHLIEAAAHTLHVLDRSCLPQVIDAKAWATVGPGCDPIVPWLIDNVQEGVSQQRSRLQMRLALERRVRSGRPTLIAITAPRPTRALRNLLPNHHQWVLATIDAPSSAERKKLLGHMASVQGLALSESLQEVLGKHLHGDGRTLEGAFKRLRLQDTRWLDAPSTLRALGLLNPFFGSSSSWDLRDTILDTAKALGQSESVLELAVYVMMRVALLSEADIAHFFEVEPYQTYAKAVRFEKRMEVCDEARNQLKWLIEEVIDRLRK